MCKVFLSLLFLKTWICFLLSAEVFSHRKRTGTQQLPVLTTFIARINIFFLLVVLLPHTEGNFWWWRATDLTSLMRREPGQLRTACSRLGVLFPLMAVTGMMRSCEGGPAARLPASFCRIELYSWSKRWGVQLWVTSHGFCWLMIYKVEAEWGQTSKRKLDFFKRQPLPGQRFYWTQRLVDDSYSYLQS